jgi:tartrate dehydrogenase/decarboxylase/D-malate dehydrogenase
VIDVRADPILQRTQPKARHMTEAGSNTNRVYKVAVIPGDGIGKEVVPEGVRVLEAAAKRFGFSLQMDDIDFASCDYYLKHGTMMPEDWKERLRHADAIFFGAVGWPASVPDHISLWGSLIPFRREFDQYANVRPVRLMPGVPSPLAGRKPGDIDFMVVRENTEGEYSSIGGRIFPGTERGGCRAGDGDDAHRRRSHPTLRIRPCDKAQGTSHFSHEIEWHIDFDAVLG